MRPLEAPPRLRTQQLAFAAHLRDPQHAPAPAGIEDRRLAVYRELFYNSLEGILAGQFPVLRRLRGDAFWHGLVRDFYREHRCHTPLFTAIGEEFILYLQRRQQEGRGDPAFLAELAHYEWVEMALALEEAEPEALAADPHGELLDGVPVLSPLAWPLAYRFPVHCIRPDHQPEQPPEVPTFLLVLREPSGQVGFKAIDATGYRLLQRLADNPSGLSGRRILEELAAEAGLAPSAAAEFVARGRRLLQALRERGAVLGTAPPARST